MVLGIQKRQWVLILFTISLPLLLNVMAIRQDVGTDSLQKIWNGSYPNPFGGFLGGSYNPLPGILLNLLLLSAALGLLAWLMIFICNKAFFTKQKLIARLIETVFATSLIARVFVIVSGFLMPLVWLPKFHDYLLGLPASPFMMNWSRWLILPATIVILCSAVFSSETIKRRKPSKVE
jgi:hypothetical protein